MSPLRASAAHQLMTVRFETLSVRAISMGVNSQTSFFTC